MKTILFSRYYSLTSALVVIFYNEMRCINLRFTYLLQAKYRSRTMGRAVDGGVVDRGRGCGR